MAKKVKSVILRYGLAVVSFALIILVALAIKRFFSLSLDYGRRRRSM